MIPGAADLNDSKLRVKQPVGHVSLTNTINTITLPPSS